MQLFYSPTSPFARKVRILAREIGLEHRIELVPVNPWGDESLRAHNPLCQVPTLIADDGFAIYDSRVICIYLDRIEHSGRVEGAQTHSLVLEAVADGAVDAGIRCVRERLRPEEQRNQDMIERQTQAMVAGLDAAERLLADEHGFDIGEIALVSALGWMELRQVIDWRAGRPKLAAWCDQLQSRPSVAATRPE